MTRRGAMALFHSWWTRPASSRCVRVTAPGPPRPRAAAPPPAEQRFHALREPHREHLCPSAGACARHSAHAPPLGGRIRRGQRDMSFTEECWRSIGDIYAAILRHPFVVGLTDGSLPRESFRFYVVQDALYLRGLARALSLAAARAPRAGRV